MLDFELLPLLILALAIPVPSAWNVESASCIFIEGMNELLRVLNKFYSLIRHLSVTSWFLGEKDTAPVCCIGRFTFWRRFRTWWQETKEAKTRGGLDEQGNVRALDACGGTMLGALYSLSKNWPFAKPDSGSIHLSQNCETSSLHNLHAGAPMPSPGSRKTVKVIESPAFSGLWG